MLDRTVPDKTAAPSEDNTRTDAIRSSGIAVAASRWMVFPATAFQLDTWLVFPATSVSSRLYDHGPYTPAHVSPAG